MHLTESDISVLTWTLGLAAICFIISSAIRYFSNTDDNEDEEMTETNEIYTQADPADLLNAKMKVLELALQHHHQIASTSAEDVAKTARVFWDFIALKPGDDSEE